MNASKSGLENVLRERFGFSGFRAGQRELIEAVLKGRDALGVLPTGGGKSLTYQLPATLLDGLTVVVSPLIALMKDQVDAFNRAGRAGAVALHSNLSAREANEALGRLHRGEAALLYVSPERLEQAAFRERLARLAPKLLVIDEAHCVCQWGYDFRPSYARLRPVADAVRPAPVLALTATAPPLVRADIVAQLGLRQPLELVGSLDRPNLRFEVHPCGAGEKPRRLKRILLDLKGQGSQIVYVGRRKDAERLVGELREVRIEAVAYHAGLTPERRKWAQEQWLGGARPVAVATVAFGMGIDKPDVRAVIHYQHPPALEAYYQEAGRAGRDGEPARCILLHAGKDTALIHFFLRNRYPEAADVREVYRFIAPTGSPPDALKSGYFDLSDEQLNVAVHALQESGKVWRDEDGNLARDEGDADKVRLNLDAMFARKNADYRRLDAMLNYAKETRCLRAALLDYFGEKHDPGYRCGNCSACEGGTVEVGRKAARDEAARIFARHREAFAAAGKLNKTALARFLHGSESRGIPDAWRDLHDYGALRHMNMAELRALAESVLVNDAVNGGDTRTASAPPVYLASAEGLPDDAVFWRSKDREFRVGELRARQVPRARGLAILELIGAHEGRFAPSMVVGILRGGRKDPMKEYTPELQALPQWGRFKQAGYTELLGDLLAMHAKGYLKRHGSAGKKLALAPAGRQALEIARAARRA
ncbi:MAG: ATP-dependent DNA helicase [Planctomycetota bacterium]|nr:ATP-dependent DNA helicase [Planctomycetota bacterium]